jgi:hypothetical protein
MPDYNSNLCQEIMWDPLPIDVQFIPEFPGRLFNNPNAEQELTLANFKSMYAMVVNSYE